jgi:hypothetical protein
LLQQSAKPLSIPPMIFLLSATRKEVPAPIQLWESAVPHQSLAIQSGSISLKLQQKEGWNCYYYRTSSTSGCFRCTAGNNSSMAAESGSTSYKSNSFVAPKIGVHWSQICCVFGQSFVWCFNLTLFTFTPLLAGTAQWYFLDVAICCLQLLIVK